MTGMGTTASNPLPLWVDLTGLPDEVVRSVRQLVGEARVRYDTPASNGPHPPPEPTLDEDAEANRIIREYEEGRVTPRVQYATNPQLTDEEFRKALDEMAEMGANDTVFLPPDWSPHDLYEDD